MSNFNFFNLMTRKLFKIKIAMKMFKIKILTLNHNIFCSKARFKKIISISNSNTGSNSKNKHISNTKTNRNNHHNKNYTIKKGRSKVQKTP